MTVSQVPPRIPGQVPSGSADGGTATANSRVKLRIKPGHRQHETHGEVKVAGVFTARPEIPTNDLDKKLNAIRSDIMAKGAQFASPKTANNVNRNDKLIFDIAEKAIEHDKLALSRNNKFPITPDWARSNLMAPHLYNKLFNTIFERAKNEEIQPDAMWAYLHAINEVDGRMQTFMAENGISIPDVKEQQGAPANSIERAKAERHQANVDANAIFRQITDKTQRFSDPKTTPTNRLKLIKEIGNLANLYSKKMTIVAGEFGIKTGGSFGIKNVQDDLYSRLAQLCNDEETCHLFPTDSSIKPYTDAIKAIGRPPAPAAAPRPTAIAKIDYSSRK